MQNTEVLPNATTTRQQLPVILDGMAMSGSTIRVGCIACMLLWKIAIGYPIDGISTSHQRTIIYDPRPGSKNDEDNLFPHQARIIGGSDARQDRYPYFVSMIDGTGRHTCGGTLVAPDVVLTAAHCRGAFTKVQIGRWDRQNPIDEYEEIAVDFPEVPHPKYTDEGFENDFMLLKLTSQSTKTYIELNSDRNRPVGVVQDEVTVIGFGNTFLGVSSPANILQEVSLSYIPNRICELSKDTTMKLSYQGLIFDSMLCAGDHGEDSCQGDSGGPLIIRGGSPSKDVLVGIISWGFGCALESFPGVYSRVSSLVDWLSNHICQISRSPPNYLDCDEASMLHIESIPVTVTIQLDDFPEEISWSIQDEIGVNTYAEVPQGAYTDARSIIRETVLLPGGQRFVFQIQDSFGDGLCCNQPGNYGIVTGSKTMGQILLSGDGVFDREMRHEFDVPISFVEETSDVDEVGPEQIPLTILIQLDSKPQEIGWKVERLGIDVETIIDIPAGVYRVPDAQIVRTLVLERDDLYYFRCYDMASDGIENGFIQLFLGTDDVGDESKTIYSTNGDFNRGMDFSFLTSMGNQEIIDIPMIPRENFLTLELYFDLYPGEVGIQLRVYDDDVVVERQTRQDTVIFFRPPRFYSDYVNERVTERIPIIFPTQGARMDFTLIVTDSFSDGLCCTSNKTEQAGYRLYYDDPVLGDLLIDSLFEEVGREVTSFSVFGPRGSDIFDVWPQDETEDLIDVKITITLDTFPDETGFYIANEFGFKVAEFPPGTYRDLDGVVEEYLTLSRGVYNFTITDVFGDGINRADNSFYRIDAVGGVDRLPIVAGSGLFVSQKTYIFALEGRIAQYPMTIKFTTDEKPEDLAFSVKRLDSLESDAFVASAPKGSYIQQGKQISETIMVVEGGLYRIFFEKATGNVEADAGQIEIVMGAETTSNVRTYTMNTNELSTSRLKVYAGHLSTEVDGILLDLRLSFDQFPHEVRLSIVCIF